MKTLKQEARQKTRGDDGKYVEVNRCQCCTAVVGNDYCSHPLTDCYGSDGANWGDIAICLCAKCLVRTERFTAASQFATFARRWGGME